MLNRYFNKRRPMANGLAAAGSPVFLCALSPLGQVLQDHYGWRGGFLILGGLLLNCCVCAALMRPLEAPRLGSGSGPGPQRPPRRLLDLSVFRDRGFVVYALAASIMVLGLFVPPVFVVSYAKDLGVPDTQAAFLLTILGFIDIFARPTAGFITGLKKVRPYSVYTSSASPCSSTASPTSRDLQPVTTVAWWSSASSSASPTAWWGPCSSRYSWPLWAPRSSPVPLASCCCWRP